MKQQRIAPALCLLLAFVSACSSEVGATPDASESSAKDPAAMVETMNLAIVDLMASPELDVERVEVQHVLIAFAGAARAKTSRLRPDAETLAAEIYCRLVDGEDIDMLMREYSDDTGAGIYVMHNGRGAPGEFARGQMAQGFGDVSWRLEPGQIGVAPFDQKESPFGWHVIKRLN